MSVRRLTDADFDTIADMRERGCTYDQIGEKIGCSGKAVSWHCLRLGIESPKSSLLRPNDYLNCPVKKRGAHLVRAFTPDEDAKLIALEARGLSDSAIGRELGRQPNSVRGRLMTLARYDERACARSEIEAGADRRLARL